MEGKRKLVDGLTKLLVATRASGTRQVEQLLPTNRNAWDHSIVRGHVLPIGAVLEMLVGVHETEE